MIRPAFRSPRRVTITLPFATYQDLQERADDEGRSLSNLAAFLLESALSDDQETSPASPESRTLKQAFR
jgi:CopG-like RHH_1 or ribbon-helix-helix domain, RHH_5